MRHMFHSFTPCWTERDSQIGRHQVINKRFLVAHWSESCCHGPGSSYTRFLRVLGWDIKAIAANLWGRTDKFQRTFESISLDEISPRLARVLVVSTESLNYSESWILILLFVIKASLDLKMFEKINLRFSHQVHDYLSSGLVKTPACGSPNKFQAKQPNKVMSMKILAFQVATWVIWQ